MNPIFWLLVAVALICLWGCSWPYFKSMGESVGFFKKAVDEMAGKNEDDEDDEDDECF